MARNAYVPSAVDGSRPEQRIVEMAVHLPPGGAVTGWAALRLARAAYFDGVLPDRSLLPVPLVVGRRAAVRTHPGTEVSYEPVEPAEVRLVHDVPVTLPDRALFDEMRRRGSGRRAVIAFDMAAAAGLVTVRQMREYQAAHTRWRRSTEMARALALGSERSRSPNETRLRLIWLLDARLPQPRENREVFDLDGELVCVADLFDEEAGLVVEFDGAEHRKARRHARDVAREERCRQLGLEYAKVTGPDLRDRRLVVDRLRSARSRALFLPAGARAWTLDYPPGWSPFW